MTSSAAGLRVIVRCRRIQRLSIWGSGSARAMAGGLAVGGSAKSGIWDGVDADSTTEGVPSTVMIRQRILPLEQMEGNWRPVSLLDASGVSLIDPIWPPFPAAGLWRFQIEQDGYLSCRRYPLRRWARIFFKIKGFCG